MLDSFVGSIGYWNALWIICVLVFIHELGHYSVARWCGVRVETFSVGFGRELIGWTDRHGTRWKISLLPLGGYVKMYGEQMSPTDENGLAMEMTEEEKSVSFAHKSLGARAAVVAAGPAANFLFAIVAFAALFVSMGKPTQTDFMRDGIGAVTEGSAAEEAGLLAGDRILSIDGVPLTGFDALRSAVMASEGRPLTLRVERESPAFDVVVTPKQIVVEREGQGSQVFYQLGVSHRAVSYDDVSIIGAVIGGAQETWRMSVLTLAAVGEMITGSRGAEDLGGPIRIVDLTNDFAQLGIVALVNFAVMLSINLGLINLFPIPMLDGGHLLFYAAEAIRGKPLGEKAQEYGLRFGLAVILGLMGFVIFNDLSRIVL